jgi:hypothetical protein
MVFKYKKGKQMNKTAEMNGKKCDVMIGFRVPKELKEKLDKWCEKEGMRQGNIIKYLIVDFLYGNKDKK